MAARSKVLFTTDLRSSRRASHVSIDFEKPTIATLSMEPAAAGDLGVLLHVNKVGFQLWILSVVPSLAVRRSQIWKKAADGLRVRENVFIIHGHNEPSSES
jgi:hypothetical protein